MYGKGFSSLRPGKSQFLRVVHTCLPILKLFEASLLSFCDSDLREEVIQHSLSLFWDLRDTEVP